MTEKRADENVVEMKRPSKDKHSSKRLKNVQPKADSIDEILRDLFGKAGLTPDAEAVKYQIAQCAVAVRSATAPISDVLSLMAGTIGELVKVNNQMVATQNSMVAAIENLQEHTVSEISSLQDKIAELEAQTASLEDVIDRKYRDDLVARDRRPSAA